MPPDPSTRARIVLIGAASPGMNVSAPLRILLGALPAKLPATIFVATHEPMSDRASPLALASHTSLRVKLAEDGLAYSPGEVYIGPPDRHLALQGGVMRVYHSPRENGARPSIDVLFRSAAVDHGSSVVGVLLDGALDDGSVGLSAIRRCGGITVREAPLPSARAGLTERLSGRLPVDYEVTLEDMAALLRDIVQRPIPPSPPVPEDVRVEANAAARAAEPQHAAELPGQPTPMSCPECGGPLSRVLRGDTSGYRCHLGHAHSPEVLLSLQSIDLERALWMAVRILKERGVVLSNLAQDSRKNSPSLAERLEAHRRELDEHASTIRGVIPVLTSPHPETKVP